MIMKLSIPIIILMANNSEFDIYRNKIFLPLMKLYLQNYGIFGNVVFVCNDEESKLILKDNEISDDNIFYAHNEKKISIETGLEFVYECLFSVKCDWFISLTLSQPIKNINIIYEGIRNISYQYDMILFSTYINFDEKMEIHDGKINPEEIFYGFPKRKIVDETIFLSKKRFYMECCEKSGWKHKDFTKLYWKGNYYIVDNLDEVQMVFSNKNQIDGFINFLKDVKYKSNIV